MSQAWGEMPETYIDLILRVMMVQGRAGEHRKRQDAVTDTYLYLPTGAAGNSARLLRSKNEKCDES